MDECEVCGSVLSGVGPACMFCYFTGRYFEKVLISDERSNVLEKVRSLEHVVRAEVWHNGNGAFALAVELDDGRLMFPGVPMEVMGRKVSYPAIPLMGENWAVAVVPNPNDDDPEVTLMPDEVDDDGLYRTIKEVSELGAAMA